MIYKVKKIVALRVQLLMMIQILTKIWEKTSVPVKKMNSS